MEDKVDSSCMVFYEEPISHVLTLAVYWQWLAMANVVDKQRYQLLRELVRTIVVRAVGNDGRHAIGIVESTHEVVATSL